MGWTNEPAGTLGGITMRRGGGAATTACEAIGEIGIGVTIDGDGAGGSGATVGDLTSAEVERRGPTTAAAAAARPTNRTTGPVIERRFCGAAGEPDFITTCVTGSSGSG